MLQSILLLNNHRLQWVYIAMRTLGNGKVSTFGRVLPCCAALLNFDGVYDPATH